MDSYIGNRPISEAAGYRREYIAAAGQTTFSFAYLPGYLDVFLNGVKLGSADFTATDGATVTLAESADSGDVIALIAWSKGEMAAGGEYVLKAGDTMTGDLSMGDSAMLGLKVADFFGELDNGSSGAAKTITLSAAQKQKILLSESTTLTINASGVTTGHYQVRLIQDGTGGRTVAFVGIAADQWLNSAAAPAINTAANGQTIVTIFVAGGAVICASANKVGAI